MLTGISSANDLGVGLKDDSSEKQETQERQIIEDQKRKKCSKKPNKCGGINKLAGDKPKPKPKK